MVAGILVLSFTLMVSPAAFACWEIILGARLNQAAAVLQVRVLEFERVRTEEPSPLCDREQPWTSCELLEVRFEVVETLKGAAADLEVAYARPPHHCRDPIEKGEEYLLILQTADGAFDPGGDTAILGEWEHVLSVAPQLSNWKKRHLQQ